MSSSVPFDDKNKDTIILYEGPTQWLDDTTLTAEAQYPINFTQLGKWFVWSLHYNGSNCVFFFNATKKRQIKAKDSEIKGYALSLGTISKDFTIDNMKKTRLKGTVKVFPVNVNATDTNDILDIHRHLMKKHDIV